MKGQIYSSKFLNSIKLQESEKCIKNHKEKMSARVNGRMSKIMFTPIKVGRRTHATYANCRTLLWCLSWNVFNTFSTILMAVTCVECKVAFISKDLLVERHHKMLVHANFHIVFKRCMTSYVDIVEHTKNSMSWYAQMARPHANYLTLINCQPFFEDNIVSFSNFDSNIK